MKKQLLPAILLALSAQVFAQQSEAKPGKEVERDMCGARILISMIDRNISLECRKLGTTSIDELLSSGYRVTATALAPHKEYNDAYYVIFIEKAGK